MPIRKTLPLRVITGLAGCALLAAAACVIAQGQEEKVLFEKKSPFSTVSVTEDAQGMRTLMFDHNGVRQSVVKPGDPDHLDLAYARVVPVGLTVVENPRRALMVGLGGGTVSSFLHKHYPRTAIDVVELDPVVVEAAKQCFGVREDATLKIHVGDGRRYIEECKETYDLILLDAFGPDSIPRSLATREFLAAVRRALSPQGIVVANIWGRNSNKLYDDMVLTYLAVFPELYIFDVPEAGNKILLASPRRRQLAYEDLAQRAATLSVEKRWRFNLGESVLQGYSRAQRQDFRGQVLTDAEEGK